MELGLHFRLASCVYIDKSNLLLCHRIQQGLAHLQAVSHMGEAQHRSLVGCQMMLDIKQRILPLWGQQHLPAVHSAFVI